MSSRLSGRAFALSFALAVCASVAAQELSAPPRIDLPHAYYYHEMYLPQLTAGPSSLAWSPDSRELVYSSGGSLWRQRTDSGVTTQLTDGPGYDYEPDWSPDGRSIVYCSQRGGVIELWRLEIGSGRQERLTELRAVSIEPRYSPDGRRIIFVSTNYNRRFHVFVASIDTSGLHDIKRITGENRSSLPRYYYSAYDHEINPTWTRDGESIVYVSNRGRIHGTGGFWRVRAVAGAEPVELRYEETNWRARPEFSPDGGRIVYSSYLGRNWLQLWLMPGNGGEPLPLSYGDWDESNPRWSPDGLHIASVSNEHGYTQIRITDVPGASTRLLDANEFRRLHPFGRIHIAVRDGNGTPTPARVALKDANGRTYAPGTAWIQAADFDRDEHPFDALYFHVDGDAYIDVPAGEVFVDVMKGPERVPVQARLKIEAGATVEFTATLPERPWLDGDRRWVSGDVHVHMNYGGIYRNTPAHLALQAAAEDLSIVHNVIVNKEQRVPDAAYGGRRLDPASRPDALIVHGQEFHTSYWGHLGLLDLHEHLLLPGYAGYPNTAAASLYPMNADVADLAHAQSALVGYVHPYEEEPEPFSHPTHTDADELPVDMALGRVDYMEIVGFSDHQATAGVWYRLLNLGFHLPAAGGTDAMANYAVLRGPVGMNRTYASVPSGPLDHEAWIVALRAGRSFATNGPLLSFELGGQSLGATLAVAAASRVPYHAQVRSIVPLDHAQIVCNGALAEELKLSADRKSAVAAGRLRFDRTGWCVLRAFTAKAEYPVLDNFVYATTSPIYVTVAGLPARSPKDARYFAAWIDHLTATTAAYPDWNSPAERAAVLARLSQAKSYYEQLQ
jgi:TolB protein